MRRVATSRATAGLRGLLIVAVLASCGGAAQPSEAPGGGTSAAPSPAPSASSGSGPTTSASEDPGDPEPPTSATPDPTVDASTEPTEVPSPDASLEPSPGAAGDASACAGTEDNRAFYVSAAESVAWTVYCPVLPAGWHVTAGQYRGAGGGRLEVSYVGPRAARFDLRQGAFCKEDDGCVPPGLERGSTAFGERSGVLVEADGGSWVVVVDRGATPSWLLSASGMDEEAARSIAEDVVAVGD